MEKAKVYFSKEISPEKLIEIYEKLGVDLKGNVGIKVSTGEAGSKGYLKANLIGPLVEKLNGTIIECNTAYPGARNNAVEHMQVAKEHGFVDMGNGIEIMDGIGEIKIPVPEGSKHLKYDLIGKGIEHYDNGGYFEGEYLNGKHWNGEGEEYNEDGILIYKGKYLEGKKVDESLIH